MIPKQFKVTATMTTDLVIFIEAENQEAAEEMAYEIDGGDFVEVDCSWVINDVTEVKPEKKKVKPPMTKNERAVCGQLLSEWPVDWTLAQVLENLRDPETAWCSDEVSVWEGVETLGNNAVANMIEDLVKSL